MLLEARAAALEFSLNVQAMIPVGEGSLLLPWVGTKKLCTLTLALNLLEVEAATFGHAIELPKVDVERARALLEHIANSAPPSASALAERIAKPTRAKFDAFLPSDLMQLVTVVEQLDVASIPGTARELIARSSA